LLGIINKGASMKSKLARFLAAVLFLPILGIAVAHAQSDETIKADVPFDFYAGTQKLPAGTYDLKFDVGSSHVQITDGSRHGMFLMRTDIAESKTSNPALVFDHLRDSYFLKTLKTSDIDMNFSVRDAEKRLALNASPTEVVVAANLH
jgi:hypothetical protein